MTNLSPASRPVPFASDVVPYGTLPFHPVVVEEGEPVLVTGGPGGLNLISLNDPPRPPWTIPARVRIAGFAVVGSDIYVQDGPVLSVWSLVFQVCHRAVNLLVAGRHWTGGENATATQEELRTLYALPAKHEAEQQALMDARRRVEWARLLDDAKLALKLAEAVGAPAVQLVGIGQMALDLESLITGQPGTGTVSTQPAYDTLVDVAAKSAAVDLSAPVVRRHQIHGRAAAMVMVLGGDGRIHPLDDALAHAGAIRVDTDALPTLAMTETQREGSEEYLCHLAYVRRDGAVRAIDASAFPLRPLAAWPTHGALDPLSVLPLSGEDGLFWGGGGGLLGADLFAVRPDPSAPAVLSVPHNGSAAVRNYQINAAERLALASTPATTHVMSYASDAKRRDRSGARTAPKSAWWAFWPPSQLDASNPRPLLVLEIDEHAVPGPDGPGFRVFAANTADTADRTWAWLQHVPAELAAGVFQAWPNEPSLRPAWVRTTPVATRTEAWFVARDGTPVDWIRAVAAPDADGSAWQRHFNQLLDRYHGDLAQASHHLGELPLPPLGSDSLHNYGLGSLDAVVGPPARAELDLLGKMPMALTVLQEINYYSADANGAKQLISHAGPLPMRAPVWNATLDGSTTVVLRLDGNSSCIVDPRWAGHTLSAATAVDGGSGSVVLQAGVTNTLTLLYEISV